jgi:hypothetical protein
MDDLIEALTIFRKYENAGWPLDCMDCELRITEINPDDVDKADIEKLATLGFSVSRDEGGYFYSIRFGSA